jgi:hypothetical protein
MDKDELTAEIEDQMQKPAQGSVDGQQVTLRSIDELIAADEYLARKRASAQSHQGLSFTTIKQPGARG